MSADRTTTGLHLFKSLIKDGCVWHGDILSSRWSEILYCESDEVWERAKRTLETYQENVDYKIDGLSIFIC